MSFMSLIFGAIAGVIAAVIARIFADPKENKNTYTGAFVVLLMVGLAISHNYVQPWWEMRAAESQLQEIAAFKAIKRFDPATYAKLIGAIKDAVKGGGSKQQVVATAQAELTKLVQRRVPTASDEAVVGYMTSTMNALHEVYEKGGDTCHHMLFPGPGETLDAQKIFSKQTMEAELNAIAKVIETSARDPQPIPTSNEVNPRLEPIIRELAGEYGNDLALMQHPNAPLVDKRKVCTIAVSLYDKILALPEDQSGKVLRYMMSQT